MSGRIGPGDAEDSDGWQPGSLDEGGCVKRGRRERPEGSCPVTDRAMLRRLLVRGRGAYAMCRRIMCDGERELTIGIVMRVGNVRHRERDERHQQNWCDRRGARTNPSQHH